MDQFTTGIPYIDQNLQALEIDKTYLIKSNYLHLNHIFEYNIINNFLVNNKRCLFITSQNANSIIDDCIFLGFDFQQALESQKLVILEIPAEMDIILNNTNNISIVIDDLNHYMINDKPDLLILDSLKNFINNCNHVHSKLITNRIFNYFKEIQITKFIDYSTLDVECQTIAERFTRGIFTFKYQFRNPIHSLNYHDFETSSNHDMLFILDSLKSFNFPHIQTNSNVTIHDVDNVFYHSDIKDLTIILNKFLSKQTQYIIYTKLEDISNRISNEQKTIIFVPQMIDNIYGLDFVRKLRNKFINIKIIFVCCKSTSPNQRVRAIRIGATRFLSEPFNDSDLKEILLHLYPAVKQSESNYKITVHYKNNIDLHVDLNSNTYYEAVYRLVKDYAQKSIEEAHSIQFFKILITDMEKNNIISAYKQYKKLLTILEFKDKNSQSYLIAFFDNLSESEINKTLQSIQLSINTRNVHYKHNTVNIIKNLLTDENINSNTLDDYVENNQKTQFINYPFDNTDIDDVIKRIF